VSGPREARRAGAGVAERPDGAAAIGGRDTRADARREVHADGELSAVRFVVLRHHERQPELARPARREGHAHHAARVPQHERELFLRQALGGDNQVAFVLALLVVRDDDELTLT
jgi:hypothetical protein